jgi:PIN domain nuclease of toxin-antitoxin system
VNLLLDTHVLLWCLSAPDKLSAKTRKRIERADQVVFVSAASAWEIEIKRDLGKLKAPKDLAYQLQAKRFTELPLEVRHTAALSSLPRLHQDPFDRMLIAQAMADGLTLVTADGAIRAYPVPTISA